MGDVVNLGGRLPEDRETCPCGSQWFELVSGDDRPPAVTVNREGSITGYGGALRCRDCGRDL